MSHSRNVAANYLGAAATVLVPLLAVPAYLDRLGPSLWGLASFALTLVALLSLIEAGLGQILSRDFALKAHEPSGSRAVLAASERLYWAVAGVGGVVLIVAADPIAKHWLNISSEFEQTSVHCIRLAALLLAFQLPSAVYRSALIGHGEMVKLNAVGVTTLSLRHGGAVVAVTAWPSVEALLSWHASVALLDLLWKRYYVTRVTHVGKSSASYLKEYSLRPGLVMSGAVLLGVLASQLDRIVLSYLEPIETVGFFNIAYMVALGVLQATIPLMLALSPLLARAANDATQMRYKCLRLFRWSAALSLAGTALYVLVGEQMLLLWLNDEESARQVKPILDYLLVGSAFNLIYQVGYQRWIALGYTKNIAFVNALGLGTTLLLSPTLISHYGAMGATASWLAVNVVGSILSLCFIFRPINATQNDT